jgi:hypothetical protein
VAAPENPPRIVVGCRVMNNTLQRDEHDDGGRDEDEGSDS